MFKENEMAAILLAIRDVRSAYQGAPMTMDPMEIPPLDPSMTSDAEPFDDPYLYIPGEEEVSQEMTQKLHATCSHPDYQYTVLEALTLLPNGIDPKMTIAIRPSSGWELNNEWQGERVVEVDGGKIEFKKEKEAPKEGGKIVTTEYFNEVHMIHRCDDLVGKKSSGILADSIMYSIRIPVRRLKSVAEKSTTTDASKELKHVAGSRGKGRK